jgi:hypothetical protein
MAAMSWKSLLYSVTIGYVCLVPTSTQGQERAMTGAISFRGSVHVPGCRHAWDAEQGRLVFTDCPSAIPPSNAPPAHLQAKNIFSGEYATVIHQETQVGHTFAIHDRYGKRVSSGSYRITVHVP